MTFTEWEILLNGTDIKKYAYLEYLSAFSVVFQDFNLLSDSLEKNVVASNSFDTEKVMDCIDKTGLSERVTSLDHGINTTLYKIFDKSGVEISGGEAQKVAIASALYKDAPFIVLDEPSAALDSIFLKVNFILVWVHWYVIRHLFTFLTIYQAIVSVMTLWFLMVVRL